MSRPTRASLRILLAAAAAVAVLVTAPFLGASLRDEAGSFIFWQLRVPRVLMALVVGAMFSLVGAVYQTIFFNPLAAPSTVGTSAGATLGALVAIVFGAGTSVLGVSMVTLSAFLGAVAASLVVALVAASGRARVNDIILAGIACSLAAGALSSGLQYSADASATVAAVRWSLGHLPQVGYRGLGFLLPLVAIASAVLLGLTRSLEALHAGDEIAHSRGVNVTLVRAAVICFGSLGVAACVAWCGPIPFIELIVPHFVRLTVGVSRRVLLPMSMVVGGAFLVLCDTAARTVVPGREIPVGVITAALGAPMLIVLIARQARPTI